MTQIKEGAPFDIAGYNLDTDTIWYDQRLNNYPKLKERIIQHELYHAKHREKIFRHMYIDMKDIFVFISLDFYRYAFIANDIPRTRKQFNLLYYYYIFDIIRSALQVPIFLVGLVTNTIIYAYINIRGK